MTGSTVLVVRVPRPIEDIDACVEHIKRGLCDGILILGAVAGMVGSVYE